jgi:hypothetical protein
MRKPESRIPRRRPGCRHKDDIKMEFIEIMCEVVGWVHLSKGIIH